MSNAIKTTDDARDLAIAITDNLVSKGLVPDCLDTDKDTEFEYQDVIFETICARLNIPTEI